ncbi:hypothetical protein, partial [Mesorhizobium sp.]|uniref:hypothetical protein n=1 Tax=Mesorhizobium sp. TaxID=1871066 RepID=UPI00257AF379
MSHEPIGEPPLDQHGQIVRGTHERASHRLSSSRAAWFISSSGAADRYQVGVANIGVAEKGREDRQF